MGSIDRSNAARFLSFLAAGAALAVSLETQPVAAQSPSPAPATASASPSVAPAASGSEAPSAAASSAPSAQPQRPSEPKSGVPNPGAPRATNYLPTIDIIPQTTFATNGDYTPGQPVTAGTAKLGGKITEALFGPLTASYQHGYIDETIGNPGRPINGLVDDPTDDFRLNYDATPAFTTALGYFYRHRTCCPAANDPTNLQPLSVHEAYLELDYAFPAIAALNGAKFSVTGRLTQTLAHHPTPQSVLAANPQLGGDEGDRIWPTGGASFVLPVDAKNGFSVFGTYSFAKDYFDYQPIAFWYNIVDYGFTKTVDPALSFTLDSTNLTQHTQGYPFAGKNTIHRAKFVLSADFHFANLGIK